MVFQKREIPPEAQSMVARIKAMTCHTACIADALERLRKEIESGGYKVVEGNTTLSEVQANLLAVLEVRLKQADILALLLSKWRGGSSSEELLLLVDALIQERKDAHWSKNVSAGFVADDITEVDTQCVSWGENMRTNLEHLNLHELEETRKWLEKKVKEA